MKKYKVSLALKIPANFEVELIAKTEQEALKKALDKFNADELDDNSISDADFCNAKLDIDIKHTKKIGSGVYIEEICN